MTWCTKDGNERYSSRLLMIDDALRCLNITYYDTIGSQSHVIFCRLPIPVKKKETRWREWLNDGGCTVPWPPWCTIPEGQKNK